MTSFLPPATGLSALAGLNPNGVATADLYARVSKTLLTQNPSISKLSNELTQDQAQLSGLGQLHSALSDFHAVAQSLGGQGLQTAATPSNGAVLGALTSSAAKPGTHAIEVRQLARAQQLVSAGVKTQDTAIGSGGATIIKVELGTASGNGSFNPGRTVKTVNIDATNNTLQGIAAAFKAAGVDTKVVHSGSSYTLNLTGESGGANSLRISVGGDPALQKLLSYNPAGGPGLTETAKAQDALLSVDGKQVTSASNIVTGAIGGAALALKAKGATSVVIAQNAGQIATNVGNFVSAYNDLNSKLSTLSHGALRSDGPSAQVGDQLRQIVGAPALGAIGVTQGSNGALHVDSLKLKNAISADSGAVVKLFSGDGKGITDRIASTIGQVLGTSGSLTRQEGELGRSIAAIAHQKDVLSKALSTQTNSLVQQYAQASKSATSALPGLPAAGSFDFLA
ncbi:MAG: flagellar filament capping protein FliD [Pseudomonadota bacterium]